MINNVKTNQNFCINYVNEKIKNSKGVDKLKVEGTVYEDALQRAVLTRESESRMNIIAMENLIHNLIHKNVCNRSKKN